MDKAFCDNCGNRLSAGAEFCDSCGKSVRSKNKSKATWYSKNILPLVNFVSSKAETLSPSTIMVSLIAVCLITVISFVAIGNQRSIQRQLQMTEQQLSTIASSTNEKLDQQGTEIDQKTSQISALEADVKSEANSGDSSSNISGILSALAPSVVKVVCESDDSGQDLQEGSGLLYHSVSSVYGPYYVETNLHVVQTSDGSPSACLIVIYPDYTNTNNYLIYETSGYQVFEQGVDMAILTPELSDTDDAGTMDELALYTKERTADTYCSSSNIGDHISILGYPGVGGSSLTATDGIISGYEYDDGVRFIKTSAEIEHGNSGGVAIEDSGCILGIPTFVDQGDISSIGRILDLNDLFNN